MDLRTLLKPYRADVRRELIKSLRFLLEGAGLVALGEDVSPFQDKRFNPALIRDLAKSGSTQAVEARYWLSDLEYPGFKEDCMRYVRSYGGDIPYLAAPEALEQLRDILQPDSHWHVRGYITKQVYYWDGRTKGAVLPPREMKCPKSRYIPAQRFPRECIFHFQPTGSAYSDIPSFEDLYNFLKFRHLRYIIAGRDFYSLLEKSDRTTSRVLDLFNWEEDPSNRYQMQRMLRRHSWKYRGEHGSQPFLDLEHECRERYAKLALRSIGLKLPAKMSKRRKHWSEKLQAFGLEVCQILRTA